VLVGTLLPLILEIFFLFVSSFSDSLSVSLSLSLCLGGVDK